jgi:hypothetical protein
VSAIGGTTMRYNYGLLIGSLGRLQYGSAEIGPYVRVDT